MNDPKFHEDYDEPSFGEPDEDFSNEAYNELDDMEDYRRKSPYIDDSDYIYDTPPYSYDDFENFEEDEL